MRTMTARYRTALACRLPPRLRRCQVVLPLAAGTGAAQPSQGRLEVDALGVVADEDEHLGRGARAHAVGLHQLRCEVLGQLSEAGIMVPNFGVEGQPAASDGTQTGLGRGCGRGERAWAQGGEMPEQRHLAAQAFDMLAQCRGRAEALSRCLAIRRDEPSGRACATSRCYLHARPPLPDPEGVHQATLGEKQLNVSKAQAAEVVKPYGMPDDLRR
jgi:hypothetical protein